MNRRNAVWFGCWNSLLLQEVLYFGLAESSQYNSAHGQWLNEDVSEHYGFKTAV